MGRNPSVLLYKELWMLILLYFRFTQPASSALQRRAKSAPRVYPYSKILRIYKFSIYFL